MHKNLESSNRGTAIALVRFATVALAAELRRLVAAGRAARRVIRSANEEHGRVVPAWQTGLRAGGYLHHVHQVLVVAGRAHDNRRVVIGSRVDEESIVRNEPAGIRASHLYRTGSTDGAIPVILATATHHRIQSHRVIIEVVP